MPAELAQCDDDHLAGPPGLVSFADRGLAQLAVSFSYSTCMICRKTSAISDRTVVASIRSLPRMSRTPLLVAGRS